jgi:hypothetical protein
MQVSDNALDSEQKLRWRTWQEKRQRADRLADRRIAILAISVSLILLACILYYASRSKASFDSAHLQRTHSVEFSGSSHVLLKLCSEAAP